MSATDCSLSATPSALKQALERLKPGRPKRGSGLDAQVEIQAGAGFVVIQLRTASVRFEAVTSRAFSVSMPLSLFDQLCEDHVKGRKAFMWTFGDGWARDGAVTLEKVPVKVRIDGHAHGSNGPAIGPAVAQALESRAFDADSALEDAPLGAIYAHFRTAPAGTTPGTPGLIAKYAAASAQMDRAARALERLGIGRSEVDAFVLGRFCKAS